MAKRTPLLLLPGLLCDAALWRHQVETLGDIAEPVVADMTQADQLGPLARSILADAPETFALAGFSMGGYLAFEILRQAPDRVDRLALLDTTPHPDSHEQLQRHRDLIDLARRSDFKGVTRRLLPILVHPGRIEDMVLVDDVIAMAERVGREAYLRQQTAIMTRPDSRHDLRLIHCPTLVLCGRQDAMTPIEAHEEMADAIPHGSLVVIEDCGHLAPLERPRAVSAVMRLWLQTPVVADG